jgi:hypothetical protein
MDPDLQQLDESTTRELLPLSPKQRTGMISKMEQPEIPGSINAISEDNGMVRLSAKPLKLKGKMDPDLQQLDESTTREDKNGMVRL